MYKCCAGIVLFNPDIERLMQSIKSISIQVDKVYCFDNNSSNTSQLSEIVEKYTNVEIIKSAENVGIAKAMNCIASEACNNKFDWLLTLDQDSVCTHDMISTLLEYADKRPAIICPQVIDKRRPPETLCEAGDYSYVDFCITSGSLMNLSVWKRIGGFDEWLFIDLVDDDYCYRLRKLDYSIIRNNCVILDHELGNITQKKHGNIWIWVGSVTRLEKLKSLSFSREVTPFRTYYVTRNMVYLSRKFKQYESGQFSKSKAVTNALTGILRGKKRNLLVHAAVKGYIDGLKAPIVYFEGKNKGKL